MSTDWTNIRLPRELHAQLVKLADELYYASDDRFGGRFVAKLPDEFTERDKVPLWFVVQKAIDEFEAHRRRSRCRKRKEAHLGVPKAGPMPETPVQK